MTNTDLGACEQFVYELRRSNLIERGQLDQVIDDFLRRQPRRDPDLLSNHLISQGVLTRFQAERVVQGKAQGLVLGPYVLVDAVGQGSMGVVHKAQSKTDNNKWYAVKILPRRSMWNVRLARRQVRTFGQFQHPAVVPFVDVGTSGGLHYLVWNFVEGETLESVVQSRGRLDARMAAEFALQIAQGLSTAHQHGLFHGLLKPSNVMIGADSQVRILDFGIGSLLAENEGESLVDTMSTANALTSGLDCCCPESIMEPTHRTPVGDQYSLGCVLYYMLAGRYPFPEGSAVEKMMAHQFKQPTPLAELAPGVTPKLVAMVERLMKKKPEERFAGIDEAVDELQSGPGHGTVEAVSYAQPVPQAQPVAHAQPLPPQPSRPLPPLSRSRQPAPAPPPSVLPAPPPSVLPAPSPSVLPAPAPPPSVLPAAASSVLPATSSSPSWVNVRPAPPPAPAPRVPAAPSTATLAAVASVARVEPPPAVLPATVPTRRSMRGEMPKFNAPPGPPPMPPMSPPVVRPVASPRQSIFQAPPQYVPDADEGEGKPVIGPLGFLAIGAAVAVVCFLLMNSFLK